jgi:hypothetical protein
MARHLLPLAYEGDKMTHACPPERRVPVSISRSAKREFDAIQDEMCEESDRRVTQTEALERLMSAYREAHK